MRWKKEPMQEPAVAEVGVKLTGKWFWKPDRNTGEITAEPYPGVYLWKDGLVPAGDYQLKLVRIETMVDEGWIFFETWADMRAYSNWYSESFRR